MLVAQYDATLYAIKNLISDNNIEVIITETGWPSYGGGVGSKVNANVWYNSVLNSIKNPLSKLYGVKIFFFEAFDEWEKTGEGWERNWGIYQQDGTAKYSGLDLLTNM
eukprot:65610_1